MKAVIYITKNKVWADGRMFEWDGLDLAGVFGKIRREIKADEARIVLGNDLTYVTSVKTDEGTISREGVLKLARAQMPFPIDSECFDWKEVELVPGEKWLQLVAMERYFMEDLSAAIVKNNIKVELVTTIGVLLAEKTLGREAPVVLKWIGKEKLLMVAINGLADLVTADISEDELMVYAKQRWGLAVNPEAITYSEKDINVAAITMAERTKGEDRIILSLPILKDIVIVPGEIEIIRPEKKAAEKKGDRSWMVYGVFLVLAAVAVLLTMQITGLWKPLFSDKKEIETIPTEVTPNQTETPEPTKIDLGGYKVQILNGSGAVGEAAKVKAILQKMGFVNVDTGNTTATSESNIRMKITVPAGVMDSIIKEIENSDFGKGEPLSEKSKYDLIMILGR